MEKNTTTKYNNYREVIIERLMDKYDYDRQDADQEADNYIGSYDDIEEVNNPESIVAIQHMVDINELEKENNEDDTFTTFKTIRSIKRWPCYLEITYFKGKGDQEGKDILDFDQLEEKYTREEWREDEIISSYQEMDQIEILNTLNSTYNGEFFADKSRY